MIIQLLKRTLWYLNTSIYKLLKILLKSIQNTKKNTLIKLYLEYQKILQKVF
jgi:hypothetical protein